MGQGLEVYLNVSPDGPADLVTFNKSTRDVTLVDVKSKKDSKTSVKGKSQEQKDLGVRFLYVGEEEIRWQVSNDNQEEEGC